MLLDDRGERLDSGPERLGIARPVVRPDPLQLNLGPFSPMERRNVRSVRGEQLLAV